MSRSTGTKILKGEDLIEIAKFLIDNGYDQGICVEIAVDDVAMLKKINDDFYYRYASGEGSAPTEDIDDVNVNISGVKFRYFVKKR